MIWMLLLLLGGLALLWKGADLLSDGAAGLAQRMGISQLVIGLTIVATGTSMPEAAAGIVAALDGRGDIIVGNVFGANIADLALIGGLVALVRPLRVQSATLRREIPAMLVVIAFLWLVLRNLSLSRIDGAVLIGMFAILLALTIRTARTSSGEPIKDLATVIEPARTTARNIAFLILGFLALATGAQLAVHSAEGIGRRIGLSDAVIGSTILAIGTTLPELMTCMVAAVKGRHDISIGNLVGSVVFNSLFVLGIGALARPLTISPRFAGGPDYWILLAVASGFTAAVVLGKRTIHRLSGSGLLLAYAGYLAYLLRANV
jgi:cation:H+ antiporter